MNTDKYEFKNMLILTEHRQKKVTVGGEEFVILAPFPQDHKNIKRAMALQTDGLPINSFDTDARYIFERDSTLSVLVDTGPKWWKGPDSCLQDEIKENLYKEIVAWNTEFQENLKKNKYIAGGK